MGIRSDHGRRTESRPLEPGQASDSHTHGMDWGRWDVDVMWALAGPTLGTVVKVLQSQSRLCGGSRRRTTRRRRRQVHKKETWSLPADGDGVDDGAGASSGTGAGAGDAEDHETGQEINRREDRGGSFFVHTEGRVAACAGSIHTKPNTVGVSVGSARREDEQGQFEFGARRGDG